MKPKSIFFVILLIGMAFIVGCAGVTSYSYTNGTILPDNKKLTVHTSGQSSVGGLNTSTTVATIGPQAPGQKKETKKTTYVKGKVTTNETDPRCKNPISQKVVDTDTTTTVTEVTPVESEFVYGNTESIGGPLNRAADGAVAAIATGTGYATGQALRRPTRINQQFSNKIRVNSEANVDNSGGGDCSPGPGGPNPGGDRYLK